MRRAVPGNSAFAESTYLAFELRMLARHPEFRRGAPPAQAIAEWLAILGVDERGEDLGPEGQSAPRAAAEDDDDASILDCAKRNMYANWRLPKKKIGHREIMCPRPQLMRFQRAVLRWLEKYGPQPGDMVHGFDRNRKRSHASHAGLHVGRRVVACLDLEDFFGSVTDLHIWAALNGRVSSVPDEALNALIWAATVEVRERPELRVYERTWTTQASDLIARYVAARLPASAAIARLLASHDPARPGGDPYGLQDVAREWSLRPDDLYIGFTKTLQLDGQWPSRSRELALLLCLVTGQVRTVSRRRLVADVLRLLRLDAWLDDHSGPRSIQSLRDFLDQDLRSRLTRGPPFREVSLLEMVPLGAVWAHAPDPDVRNSDLGVRVLPQGAPTSPWLANLAAADLDNLLLGYAALNGLVYSRYADDLTFSGDSLPRRFVHDVAAMVQECGFRVNRKKIVVRRQHQRQVVTGIIVNHRPAPTTIDRRKLRAMLHAEATGRAIHLGDPRCPLGTRELRGHLAYWHMVDPTRVPWPPSDHETKDGEG